jgi:hypothetical protein
MSGAFGGVPRAAQRRRNLSDPAPYVQWTVPVGGPAVLSAKPEVRRHDPGPGVIGIDR